MPTVENTGTYIKRYNFWNPATWTIPSLYWDTFSQEQRIHAICRQLSKVIQYSDYLGVNTDDIAARLKAIENGQLDEFIVAAIEEWFNENQPAIASAIDALNDALPISEFDDVNTVKKYVDDTATAIQSDISNLGSILPESEFDDVNTVKKAIDDLETTLTASMNNLGSLLPENDFDDVNTVKAAIDIVNDKINYINQQSAARLRYGGDGTLIFEPTNVHEGLTLVSTHQTLSRDKKNNLLRFDVILRNTGDSFITDGEYLLEIPYFIPTAYSSLQLQITANIYKFDASEPVTDVSNRILTGITPARASIRKNDNRSYITLNFGLPTNCELQLYGTTPDSTLLSWNNSSFYDSTLQNALCDYFLNGDGGLSWEGDFDYSNSNDYRLDPANRKTDCSGMTYIAYSHFGFHPQNSIEESYLTDGIFVAYAPAGQKLDISNARPGDIICYQKTDENPDLRESWSHCSIYAGNNTTYEMALHYPERETLAGHLDGKGPWHIATPADEYRMNDEVNSITGQTNYGRNRCIVRFM